MDEDGTRHILTRGEAATAEKTLDEDSEEEPKEHDPEVEPGARVWRGKKVSSSTESKRSQ